MPFIIKKNDFSDNFFIFVKKVFFKPIFTKERSIVANIISWRPLFTSLYRNPALTSALKTARVGLKSRFVEIRPRLPTFGRLRRVTGLIP